MEADIESSDEPAATSETPGSGSSDDAGPCYPTLQK